MLRATMMKHQIELSRFVKSKLLSLLRWKSIFFLNEGKLTITFLNKTTHDVLRYKREEASLIQ